MKSSEKAFTLAEVLITLVIIGVIAAMTIPTLMNHFEKVEEISRLKEFYSSFSQLLNRYRAEGGVFNQDTSCWQTGCPDNDFIQFLNTQLKDGACYPKDTDTCWGANVHKYKKLSGAGGAVYYPDLYVYFYSYLSYQMKNGAMFALTRGDSGTTDFRIVVDVNGPNKGPNTLGKDTFHFVASAPNYNLLARPNVGGYWTFAYSTDFNADCNPSDAAAEGVLCAKKIINESWQMNY